MENVTPKTSIELAVDESREVRREKNKTALRKFASQSWIARRVKDTWHYWRDYFWWQFEAERKPEMFETVKAYCMFIGYPRSGHSLCGALLNAHPEAVIAHELDALAYVQRGVSREQLYSLIVKRDRWFSEVRFNRAVDFDYQVPNSWQGRFERLSVIGDKQGDLSSVRLQRSPQLLLRLREVVGVPIRIIHVVRNPFDSISTMLRRKGGSLEQHIKGYFSRTETNARLLAMDLGSGIFTIRHEDLIASPKEHLRAMAEFIQLQPDDRYLADCAGIVFRSPSRSRLKAPWNERLVETVQSKIEQYPFLRGYSFVS
jgi:hypothetical protein